MNWKREITFVVVTTLLALSVMILALKQIPTYKVTLTTRMFMVTAYCPCDSCTNGDGVTASGHTIRQGDKFCAAPGTFKFYDKVTIPGYNNNRPTVVLDRGHLIQGDTLDVYFDTHQEALNWGRQILQITIHK